MDSLDIKTNYSRINDAANQFLQSFGPGFTKTPMGHIQTDIAGAASVAGTVILRDTIADLTRYQPGNVVLSDVHSAQGDLHKFMIAVGNSMKLDPKKGWGSPVAKADEPMFTVVQFSEKLERRLYDACEGVGLDRPYYRYAAALAAVKLVSAGARRNLLSEDAGKALATYYAVAGTKVVPAPLSSSKSR